LTNSEASLASSEANFVNREASLTSGEVSFVNREASFVNREASFVNCEASLTSGEASFVNREASLTSGEAIRLVTKLPLGHTFWKLSLPVPTAGEARASSIALPNWSLATRTNGANTYAVRPYGDKP
jgi:hypothetical protein